MKDIQSQKDERNVYLQQVGIEDFRFPVKVANRDGGFQPTVADIALAVGLDRSERGTHMSRFVEEIEGIGVIDPNDTRNLLEGITRRLESESAFLTMKFPFFIEAISPVTGKSARLDVDCELRSCLSEGQFEYVLTLLVPVTTLCPCSKEISDFGAHNQRAEAAVSIKARKRVWIEDVADIVMGCASSPVYPLLKRPDEKFVTEAAYENPKFVEDVTRDVYLELDQIEEIESFRVKIKSHESIHNHNAFAIAEKNWR